MARKLWAIKYVSDLHNKTHAGLDKCKRTVIRDKQINSARKKAVLRLTKDDVPRVRDCMACSLANKTKKHPRKMNRPREWFTTDTSTNFPRSYGGNRCWFATDMPDAWSYVGFGSHKSEAHRYVKSNYPIWKNEYGGDLSYWKTDRGGEYMSNATEAWCTATGIRHHPAATDSSAGPAEKLIATLQARQRAMANYAAIEGGCELDTYDYLWDEQISYANQVRLMFPVESKITGGLSPWEFRLQERPPLERLHPWGCKAIAHVNNPTKNQSKGRVCMFLGLATNGDDGYRLFDFRTRSIFHSRSVKFFDELFFRDGERGRALRVAPPRRTDPEQNSMGSPTPQEAEFAEDLRALLDKEEKFAEQEVDENEEAFSDDEEEEENVHWKQGRKGRPQRARKQREQFDPGAWQAAFDHDVAFISVLQRILATTSEEELAGEGGEIPQSFEEAMNSPDRERWMAAIEEEKKSLRARSVLRAIRRSKIPRGRRTISCRWAFDIKKKDGKVERFKARLVARGYLQRSGLDFTETFAPTPSSSSIRLVIALALQLKLSVKHYDVKTAFLYSELSEEERVYTEPPPGTVDPHPEWCFELLRCLYGLKQSGNKWHENINGVLLEKGFKPLDADSCVYVHKSKNDDIDCIITIHVDDILCAATSAVHKGVAKLLNQHYEIKDLGELSWYLGMKIKYAADYSHVELSQRALALDILRMYRMEKANPHSTPSTSKPPTPSQKAKLNAWQSGLSYRAIVGSLQYLAQTTRPDLSHAVGVAARHCADPGLADWHALKEILHYLAGTVDYGIRYYRDGPSVIVGWSDSDWAGDKSDRKSTSGYCFMFAGGAISWKSKKQTVVARSTAEAEIVALDLATREALWFRKLAADLDLSESGKTITIHEDNEAAIAISAKHRRTPRTKHIDIQYFALCDDVSEKRIKVAPVATKDNVADAFTKALERNNFIKFREMMGVVACLQAA